MCSTNKAQIFNNNCPKEIQNVLWWIQVGHQKILHIRVLKVSSQESFRSEVLYWESSPPKVKTVFKSWQSYYKIFVIHDFVIVDKFPCPCQWLVKLGWGWTVSIAGTFNHIQ